MTQPPGSGWAFEPRYSYTYGPPQPTSSMPPPSQLNELASLAGTKRKLSQDVYPPYGSAKESQNFAQHQLGCLNPNYYNSYLPPNSWQNANIPSNSTYSTQTPSWDGAPSSQPWPLVEQLSYSNLPQLSDGSPSVSDSPASQYDSHATSNFRVDPTVTLAGSNSWDLGMHIYYDGSITNSIGQQQAYRSQNHSSEPGNQCFGSNDLGNRRPMAVDFTTWDVSENQPPTDDLSGMPWDCQTTVACVNPNCMDGIPCNGALLPPCDKEDCNDGIPCEQAHESLTTEVEDNDANDNCAAHCSTKTSESGFCCNDQCPEDTRCASPCFEEDCRMPPCDVDHHSNVYPWSHGHLSNFPTPSDCVDPRHTFQNDSSFHICDKHHTGHEQSSSPHEMETHSLSLTPSVTLSSEDSQISVTKKKKKKKEISATHRPHHTLKHHYHNHERSSSCVHRSCSKSGADLSQEALMTEFICKWVPNGDSNDADAIICGATYHNSVELQDHLNLHISTLERDPTSELFPCLWKGCSHHHGPQGFAARPKLKRHTMTHTGSAPFMCEECGRMMRTKDALDKHKRTHSGLKPFKCEVDGCGSSFATTTELKTHLTVHSGKKPHKCPICGEPFADSSNLSKHKKIHEVPKFKCPECDYKMKRWDQMRRHFLSQKHALYILESKEAEKAYKSKMDAAFKRLTPQERMIPLNDRESSNTRNRGKHSRRSSTLSTHQEPATLEE